MKNYSLRKLCFADCPSNHHLENSILDDVFPIGVDELFKLIFSDSTFYRNFTEKRKTYDIKLGEWEDVDSEKGRKVRKLYYTLSINYSIGPKCSQSKEIQTMLSESKPGENYVIDSDCYNGGVPYADNFYTTVRYCLRSVQGNKTRMIITCRVNFCKNTKTLIRVFIDKTALSGLRSSFNDFVQLLRMEIESSSLEEPRNVITRRKVKQQNKSGTTTVRYSSNVSSSPRTLLASHNSGEHLSDYTGYLITVLFATLVLVSVMNMFMYLQLVTMENSLERLMSSKLV